MTPRMVDSLLTQHSYHLEKEEWFYGLLASTIVNSSFSSPKEAIKPEAFMPSKFRSKKPVSITDMADALLSQFSAASMMYPDKFVRL